MEFLGLNNWIPVKDGDPRAVGLYRRHYSAKKYNHGQKIDYCRFGFSGVGESLILLSTDCLALFTWRYQRINDGGQYGIECTVFRNESKQLSSTLILEAESLAWVNWPDQNRVFTFVNPLKIKSNNPGYCFLKAGWRKCGLTKGKLLILEKILE